MTDATQAATATAAGKGGLFAPTNLIGSPRFAGGWATIVKSVLRPHTNVTEKSQAATQKAPKHRLSLKFVLQPDEGELVEVFYPVGWLNSQVPSKDGVNPAGIDFGQYALLGEGKKKCDPNDPDLEGTTFIMVDKSAQRGLSQNSQLPQLGAAFMSAVNGFKETDFTDDTSCFLGLRIYWQWVDDSWSAANPQIDPQTGQPRKPFQLLVPKEIARERVNVAGLQTQATSASAAAAAATTAASATHKPNGSEPEAPTTTSASPDAVARFQKIVLTAAVEAGGKLHYNRLIKLLSDKLKADGTLSPTERQQLNAQFVTLVSDDAFMSASERPWSYDTNSMEVTVGG